jgi:hypothetical protein
VVRDSRKQIRSGQKSFVRVGRSQKSSAVVSSEPQTTSVIAGFRVIETVPSAPMSANLARTTPVNMSS